jgi:DNA/RNA endonuclease YhcR with UshA esterase domain
MKNKRMACFFVSLAALLLASPALAHHGFAGRYDEEHPVTVTGTVADLQFVNPHSIIFFDVTDKTGKTERWQAELGSATSWNRSDRWTRTTLKAGDKITIVGPQNKNGSGDLNLSHESKITMTDTGKVIHNSIKAERAPPAAPAN